MTHSSPREAVPNSGHWLRSLPRQHTKPRRSSTSGLPHERSLGRLQQRECGGICVQALQPIAKSRSHVV